VNILTIHTSKGLQFPVVIIPFADWETYKSNPVWLEVNEPELPALNVAMIDSPGSLNETKYSGVATVEKEKQILDNVNLLYVATTRAEDHLHIISRKYGRVDHIDKWLSEFFEKNFPRSENQKMHIKGVMQKKHSKEKLSVNTLDYSLELNSRTDLLELKLSHQKDNKRLSASGKLEYGILFHEAMRHIDSVQDVARIKDVLLSKTICSAELASEIQVKISSLMNQQKFAAFFDSGKRSVNEPELISGTGDFRPDRLIFSENEVILVEYKTGEKDEKHQEQVMNYAGLISEIFSCKTRCFLVYVEEEIIEEVI
ncbi:MAG: 3'-5' exonuclease, partial [Bacteroidota bacterium]